MQQPNNDGPVPKGGTGPLMQGQMVTGLYPLLLLLLRRCTLDLFTTALDVLSHALYGVACSESEYDDQSAE
jgi:hypothetical protein